MRFTTCARRQRAFKATVTDRDCLVLDLCKSVATLQELEALLCAQREEQCGSMERNRILADEKVRLETERREHINSHEGSRAVVKTRSAIKLQMKRKIILRNVLASLVTLSCSLCECVCVLPCMYRNSSLNLCVLQILESGVDWAQDADLSGLVM